MNTTMKRPRGTSAEEQTILDRFATRTRRAARHNIEALSRGGCCRYGRLFRLPLGSNEHPFLPMFYVGDPTYLRRYMECPRSQNAPAVD